MTSARLSADDFITEKVIGRGAFGEVQLVSFMFVYTHVWACPKSRENNALYMYILYTKVILLEQGNVHAPSSTASV